MSNFQLDVRLLRLVAAIVDAGGVTRAAGRLHLTQSAVSHQLADAEARLGAPLFLRAGRRMVPTPAGERVLAAARRVLGELGAAEDDVRAAMAGGAAGLLRLTTECYTCYHWLPPVLATFRARWPRVEVRLAPEATRRPLAALGAGEVDVAIVSRPLTDSPDPAPPRGVAVTPLFDDELVAVIAPGHPLAARPFARAEDFAGEQVLLYNVRDDESTLLHEVLRPAGVRPAAVLRVELTEAVVELVKAGLGVSVLARWAVAPHLAAGTLAAVPLTVAGYHRRWSAATRAGAAPAYVSDFLASLPTWTPGATARAD